MRRNLKNAVMLLLMFAFSNSILAQTDSVDVFIKAQMQKRRIPGLQLAIVRDGKIIKTGNYGWSNLQDSIPVSDRTVFNINSITKAFVGVAVLQLAEAGKLNLSAPVSTYLTDLPEAWRAVTVLQLLSHTSGIPDVVDEEEAVLITPSLEEAWKKVIAMPMDFKPGERFQYNQTNYLLLGQIIDKLSGVPFQEFITKEQLAKVGMPYTTRAGFGATKDIVPHAAQGYTYRQGKLSNMFFSFPAPLQTAAGMSATAKEMAQWVVALQSQQLLKEKASLDVLWKPALLNNGKTGGFSSQLNGYAVGWPIVGRAEHPAAAAVGGGRSAVFVYPNDNLSIIVLTNLMGGNPDSFIDELAGLFIPDMKEANGFGFSPAVKSLRATLEKSGYKNAIAEAKRIRKTNPKVELSEKEINGWGYKLLKQNRMVDAIEIFKLNVFLHPASVNTYDSLGETYAEQGNIDLAISNYEQVLKLDPGNANAEQQLKKLRASK
jgi:CubicO group peptidase (beta-lactamase class C family)